jgi:hypothetical protein
MSDFARLLWWLSSNGLEVQSYKTGGDWGFDLLYTNGQDFKRTYHVRMNSRVIQDENEQQIIRELWQSGTVMLRQINPEFTPFVPRGKCT